MSAFRHLFLVPESLFNLWHSNFAPDADPIVPLSPIPRVRRWQSFCDLVPLSCGSRRTWLSCLLVSDHIFAILFLKTKLIPSQFKAEHNWVAFVSSHGLFISFGDVETGISGWNDWQRQFRFSLKWELQKPMDHEKWQILLGPQSEELSQCAAWGPTQSPTGVQSRRPQIQGFVSCYWSQHSDKVCMGNVGTT